MTSVTLRHDDHNYLRITVLRRRFPQATDTWDGDLVDTRVDYSSAAATGSYEATIFLKDLQDFRDELSGDVVDDSGLIALTTIDGVIYVEMERRRGFLLALCSLSAIPDGPEVARLRLRITPAAAARALAELERVLLVFPPAGSCHRPSPN